jgi:hypothetical protein
MPARIEPAACPGCQEPFALDYTRRRQARLLPRARLALVAGIATTLALIVLAFLLVPQVIYPLTEGTNLVRQERGMLYFLGFALCLPVACLPWWLGWRYAFSAPRRLAVKCPGCGWSGPCLITEGYIGGKRVIKEF